MDEVSAIELETPHFHFMFFFVKILLPYSRLSRFENTDLKDFRHASFPTFCWDSEIPKKILSKTSWTSQVTLPLQKSRIVGFGGSGIFSLGPSITKMMTCLLFGKWKNKSRVPENLNIPTELFAFPKIKIYYRRWSGAGVGVGMLVEGYLILCSVN